MEIKILLFLLIKLTLKKVASICGQTDFLMLSPGIGRAARLSAVGPPAASTQVGVEQTLLLRLPWVPEPPRADSPIRFIPSLSWGGVARAAERPSS